MGSSRNKPRRVAKRVVVFLLLGAVVNVVVAWGCAVLIRVDRPSEIPEERGRLLSDQHGGPRVWTYTVARTGGVRHVHSFDSQRPFDVVAKDDFAPGWSRAAQPRRIDTMVEIKPGEPILYMLVEDARGWPMLSLHCEHVLSLTSDRKTLYVEAIEGGVAIDLGSSTPPTPGGVELRPRFWYSKALPLRPIWPGFAINTVFYAAIAWLLFAAPGRVRRWRRIKRGLCPACAYPVGEGATCSECGEPHRWN